MDDLEQTVRSLESAFFKAVQRGPDHVRVFCEELDALRLQLTDAARAGTASPHLLALASASFSSVLAHASIVRSYDARFDDVTQPSSITADSSLDAPACPTASLPLFRYLLANMCFPYPSLEEKERIAEEVRLLGWRDFDKKKFEDWLNRKRNQSGFVAILRNYCQDDRDEMRRLCRVALHGSAQQKSALPDGAVEDIETMNEVLQSQYDDLADEKDSTWIDDLTTHVEAMLGSRSIARPSESGALSSDDYSDSSDDGNASDCSSTDVDSGDDDSDDDDDDGYDDGYVDVDDPPPRVIGAKRKLVESLCPAMHAPYQLCRSLSVASSTSSSSTACSVRSLSGFSTSGLTSDVWEDEEDNVSDRPAKRMRCESDGRDSMPGIALQSAVLSTDPLFTTYRTARKHAGDVLKARSRSLKRSRYAGLGVASQNNGISMPTLSSLSGLCSLDWTPVEAVGGALDAESYTVDCTQLDDGDSAAEDYTILLEREPAEPSEDTPTWSKLQIYAILRMLLSASDRPLPTSLAQSGTYAFDIDPLGAHNVIALEEMMKFTPEALSALFDTMNGLTRAAGRQIAVSTEATAVTPLEDALLALQVPDPNQDVSAPAPDVQAPVVNASASALDVDTSVMDTPVVSIDTSVPALKYSASATEQPISPQEESHSPTSSSSSDSSESDSPPALSDDSGSSSRSSSVESDIERDSLLTSPAALSADYSQLTDELSSGKVSNADPSQFQVEFGVVHKVATTDDSSCASELLERYLNDQMTWA